MDLMDEAAKAILAAGAKTSLEALVRRVRSKRDEPIDSKIVIGNIRMYAAGLQQVKTLLSPETLVPIDKFYCPPRLSVSGKAVRAKNSSDFKEDLVLIEGVAGQGKSILLRHLCSQAILEHGKIALYFEMRRMDKVKPLLAAVQDVLRSFGLPGNNESIKSLSVAKDFELYLDGFDELDNPTAEKFDRDINFISINHPFIKIIVSSRPHVGLAKSSSLHAYKIESLDRSDVHRLIRKLCPDSSVSDPLIRNLDFHAGRALELLETPLLVTLLVSQYSQTQQLPEQLAEFYDNIFPVLFERHDSFKTPYVRVKLLGLTTHTYRKVFQKFCFGSLFAHELSHEEAVRVARWSLDSYGLEHDAEQFLVDISNTSSLVNREGQHWSFIHNSIQEYYAASFLLSGTDEKLKDYARTLSKIPNSVSREQIFRFAKEINEIRFIEFVEVPFFEELSSPLAAHSDLDETEVSRWLKAHAASVAFDKNIVSGGRFFTVRTDIYGDSPIRMFAPDALVAKTSKIINNSSATAEWVSALLMIPQYSSRICEEVRVRVLPYLAKRMEAGVRIDEEKRGFAKEGDFLNSLLRI